MTRGPVSVLTKSVIMTQGGSGAVFASPETKDRGGKVTESCISFKPFDAWAPQSDWSMTLDAGEEVQVHVCLRCVCVRWRLCAASMMAAYFRH